MRVFDQRWSSAASTGGQTAVQVTGEVMQSVWFFTASTGVSTATIRAQHALSSGGPWFDEGASTALSSGALQVFHIDGPLLWVRPYCGSTGISVRVIGI